MTTLEDRTLTVLAYITANMVASTRYAYIENPDVPDLAEALRKFMDNEGITIDLDAAAEYLGETEFDMSELLVSTETERPSDVRLRVVEVVATELTKTACVYVDPDSFQEFAVVLTNFLMAKNIRAFPKVATRHFNEAKSKVDKDNDGADDGKD